MIYEPWTRSAMKVRMRKIISTTFYAILALALAVLDWALLFNLEGATFATISIVFVLLWWIRIFHWPAAKS